MAKLNFYFSLITAKTGYAFLQATKLSSGTSIIGRIVLKLCPNFLSECNKYIGTKINVTGTNGKTTTSGLISHLIKESGASVVNNAMGANMLTGVVNALSVSLNPFRKTDYSVIESDEAYLTKIYDKFDADYLVVTNLFRDQLDRYGELATTKRLIQEGIDKKPDLTLLLNADDPLVASFEGSNKIYYGIESATHVDIGSVDSDETTNLSYTSKSTSKCYSATVNSTEEAFNCPCGKALKYEKKFFAQQGHYYCDCGYRRPEAKYKADVTLYKDHSEIKLNGINYVIPLVGLFNAYNALAAIALALELGIKDIEKNLQTFKVAFGRSEVKYLNGKRTLIQLIKNPIGANEVLKTVDKNSNLLIIINDNYADGRDVSWLWDAEFEVLKTFPSPDGEGGQSPDGTIKTSFAGGHPTLTLPIRGGNTRTLPSLDGEGERSSDGVTKERSTQREIVVSGIRANDMALRLKYAGVENIKIIPDIKKAVEYIGKTADNNITILPTYTALLKINKLKELRSKKCF